MKRITITVLLVLALCVAAFFFSYDTTEIPRQDCRIVTGIVADIAGSGSDVVFKLEGKDQTFYINRALDYGFDIAALEKELLADEVTIYYVSQWSLFAPFGKPSKHIREIRKGNWTVYSEF